MGTTEEAINAGYTAKDGRSNIRDRTRQAATLKVRHKAIAILTTKYEAEFNAIMASLGYVKAIPRVPAQVVVTAPIIEKPVHTGGEPAAPVKATPAVPQREPRSAVEAIEQENNKQ